MTAQANGPTAAPAKSKRFQLPALDFQRFGSLTEGTNIPPPLPSPILEESVPTPPKTPTSEGDDKTRAASKRAAAPQAAAANGTPESETGKIKTTPTLPTGTKRTMDDTSPSSPTPSTTHPNSIRRLFSKNFLHHTYDEQSGTDAGDYGGRPQSASASSHHSHPDPSRKAKRSSRWFSRLRNSSSISSNDANSIMSHGGASTTTTNTNTNTNKRASIILLASSALSARDSGDTYSTASAGAGAGGQLSPQTPKKMGPPPPMIPELSELKSSADTLQEEAFGEDLFKDIK